MIVESNSLVLFARLYQSSEGLNIMVDVYVSKHEFLSI